LRGVEVDVEFEIIELLKFNINELKLVVNTLNNIAMVAV
jgi:hypothetical protein